MPIISSRHRKIVCGDEKYRAVPLGDKVIHKLTFCVSEKNLAQFQM